MRVGFSNSYRGTTDDAAILRVTGEKGAAFFKQSFELKIKGDLIPESAAEEIIGELQALFARHNSPGGPTPACDRSDRGRPTIRGEKSEKDSQRNPC